MHQVITKLLRHSNANRIVKHNDLTNNSPLHDKPRS